MSQQRPWREPGAPPPWPPFLPSEGGERGLPDGLGDQPGRPLAKLKYHMPGLGDKNLKTKGLKFLHFERGKRALAGSPEPRFGSRRGGEGRRVNNLALRITSRPGCGFKGSKRVTRSRGFLRNPQGGEGAGARGEETPEAPTAEVPTDPAGRARRPGRQSTEGPAGARGGRGTQTHRLGTDCVHGAERSLPLPLGPALTPGRGPGLGRDVAWAGRAWAGV